jgi:hypothetical protein
MAQLTEMSMARPEMALDTSRQPKDFNRNLHKCSLDLTCSTKLFISDNHLCPPALTDFGPDLALTGLNRSAELAPKLHVTTHAHHRVRDSLLLGLETE